MKNIANLNELIMLQAAIEDAVTELNKLCAQASDMRALVSFDIIQHQTFSDRNPRTVLVPKVVVSPDDIGM